MKIGDQQGDCIVLSERNQKNGYGESTGKVGPDQIDITNQYLAALALEYKILTRNNQSTGETIKEIFYIIETINRLDEEADQFWSSSSPVGEQILRFPLHRNGFILREDMPSFYLNSNFSHYNYSCLEYGYNGNYSGFNPNNINSLPGQLTDYKSFSGLSNIQQLDDDNKFSNYVGFNVLNQPNPMFTKIKGDLSCPHDKYYSMFMAFMLIDKYIPSGTGYTENGQLKYFADGTSDIKQEVRNITNRCHTYLRGNAFGNSLSNWIMEYPDGTNLNGLGQPTIYSYPLAQIICKINNNYPWSGVCNNYLDATSAANAPTYSALNLAGGGLSQDGGVFLAYCQSGSNVPWNIWLTMDINTGAHSLEWANLLRKVLHQTGVLMKQKSVYSSPISTAPCLGPYNFGGSDKPDLEWTSQDRDEHPDARGTSSPAFPGSYPGVDYMLLHNLYYEYLNQLDDVGNESGAYNLMDNYDELTWPYSYSSSPGSFSNHSYLYGVNVTNFSPNPHGLGFLSTDQGRIKVFQNLTSRAQIYASASPSAPNNTIPSMVEYRAGKDITLLPEDPYTSKPGFEVRAGSDFHAYIQRYVCSNGDYGNGLRTNDSTAHSNDYETDAMNTTVPIHYIDHPLSDSDLYPYGAEEDPGAEVKTNNDNMQNTLLEQYNSANFNGDVKMQSVLETEASKQRFVILPNPNNGVFKIFANKIAATEEFTIVIYDMKGLEVTRYDNLKDNVSLDVDFTQLSRGIYMVNISSTLGYKNSKKVSIN